MTNRLDQSQRATAGFTLIEMLVVLAIVGAATGMAFLGLRVIRGTSSPETIIHKIGDGLTALRYKALNTGHAQSARFDVSGKRMVAEREITIPREYTFTVTVGMEEGPRDNAESVTFLPDGSSSGVEISIANAIGHAAKLRVNWLTGLVEYVDEPLD